MFRTLSAVAMVVSLCCHSVLAQEQKESGLAAWLRSVQNRISQIAPKKTMPQNTIVAGVRGAKEDTAVKLYWKGKKGEEPISVEELAMFKAAVDKAASGDQPAAIKEFEEFMKLYPDSALIPDAKKTLDLVRAETKEEKK